MVLLQNFEFADAGRPQWSANELFEKEEFTGRARQKRKKNPQTKLPNMSKMTEQLPGVTSDGCGRVPS